LVQLSDPGGLEAILASEPGRNPEVRTIGLNIRYRSWMDEHTHIFDYMNGEPVESTVVEGAHTVVGIHSGSVCVHRGADLHVAGVIRGSVIFRPRARA